MKKEREYSFDILRVIAMTMVIIIHVSNIYSRSYLLIENESYLVSIIFNTISRISVPLFFMISGALLLDRNFNTKKYIQRLLKFVMLIAVWDIIYLIWEYFFLDITYTKLYKLIITPYRAHLWFLYTIIILYAVQPLLKLILDKANKPIKIVLFILWFILSTISMYNRIISKIFTIFSYIGYFAIGKYLYEYIKSNDTKKYNIIMIVMLLFSYIASIYLNMIASNKFNMFYNLFFAYRTPYIMLNSFIVFILIYNLFHNKKQNKIIMLLSDLSLGVYLIHGVFLDVTSKFIDYKLVNPLFGIPAFTIFIFIFSTLLVYFLKKIKLFKTILQ